MKLKLIFRCHVVLIEMHSISYHDIANLQNDISMKDKNIMTIKYKILIIPLKFTKSLEDFKRN